MSIVTFTGIPSATVGELPAIGSLLPEFVLTGTDLSDVASRSFIGKRVVLNIFPSLDTGVCAMSVHRFNELVARWPNTVVICTSQDLPFAMGRFCGAEGIDNAITASAFRSDFGQAYGVTLVDGPLRGLFARSVVIADESGRVVYTRLSPEIAEEPDYDAAAAAVLG
ncbi:MAG: thiol peroxidase [Propionibacteriaceae bacterium]|jgi:thiol peroxidase|nr:thiol peroxidase [Propionibacteriaceae bacterium]